MNPVIQVIRKAFDPDYYKWRAEIAIKMGNKTDKEKLGMIKNLIIRAYEQGVMDGKNDQDYYSDY